MSKAISCNMWFALGKGTFTRKKKFDLLASKESAKLSNDAIVALVAASVSLHTYIYMLYPRRIFFGNITSLIFC